MKKWVTDKSGKLIQIDDGKPESSAKKSSSGANTGKASASKKSTSGTSSAAKSVGKSLYAPKSDNYGSGYIYSVGGPQNLSDEDKQYYSIAAGNDIWNRRGTAAGLWDNFNSMRYQRDAAKQIKQGNYIQKAIGAANSNEAWANTLALYPSAWVADVLSELGIIADDEIATSKLAEMGLRARSGDASVLTEYDDSIAKLKNEGLDNRWYNKLFGTNRYANQDVIDEAERQRSGMVDLLQLNGMETIRGLKPKTSMIDYTEDDYYADLNTILHKAQGIDIPQEDYLEAAKRVRGFVGNTAVEQAAFADPSGQWMDKYRGLYGQRMNTLDKYIDKHSGAAGTEYDFSAEDYTSYQRAYDRYMERQAEQEKKLNDYNAARAEDHQKLANNPGYAVDSRYVQGGDYWRLEDDGYTETVDYGSMMNDLVHASAVPGEIDEVIRKLDSVPNGYGTRALAWADTIRYMSDADRKDFTYLYNTQGIEAAEQFLDSIRWNLDRQYMKNSLAELERNVRDGSALEKLFYAVGARGAKLLSELNGAVAFIDAVTGANKLNEYSPGFYYGQAANIIDSVNSGAIEDSVSGWYPDWLRINGKSLPAIGYNALTSAADSLANAALFGGGAAISMSFGAFDSSYQAGLESGKPLFDNLVDSTVDGAIEALTEYVSVEALFSDTLNPIGYLAKNVFSEASEEVTGDVLRLGYDVWAHGEANAINARIDELRVMGYDPQVARRQAIQEWVSGLGETAVTSAFSGGVSALPGATTSYAENRSTGKALQENAGETGYQSLIDLAGTVELSKSGQKILDELRGLAAQRQVVPETEVTQKEGIEYPGQQAQEQVVPETEVAQKEAVEYPDQQAQEQVVTEAEVTQKEAVEYPGQQTVSKPSVSKSKLGQLYREVMQKLDEKARDVLREFMSFDLAKELRQRGLPAQEAKDLAGSVLRIQDGSFSPEDVQAVSGSMEARGVLSAWTALAGAVDKAKGALGELAGMLEKKDSTNAETETGEEPVSMEAVQPEDEFDVQAAEVQAEAENLLSSGGEASTLDGEEIEVLGVAPAEGAESDGAPRVRIRTVDGTERSVAAKDIAYGAKDAGVYQLAAYAGKYGRNADQMFNLRLSGQDVTEYARAFSKAAQVGSDGRNLSLLMNSGEIDALTPGQAQAAYDIGRAARAQRSQAQQEALGAKGANVQVGRLDVSQIERVSLNKQQRASVDAMGKLAKALGINVRFVESKADESGRYTTENGSYDPNTRTLTLDIHAGSNFIKDTRYAVMNTAGHELTHYIRQFADSALWDGYQDFVMDHLDGKMNLEKEIQKRMAQNSKLDRDGAIEEIVADASGEALSKITEAQLQDMMQENPTLMQKIARFMKKWIGNLKKQIEIAFKGTEAKTEVARQMQDALDEMAEMWNSLLVEAGRSANASRSSAVAGVEIDAESQIAAIKNSRRSLEDSEYAKNPDKMAAALAKAIDVSEAQARRYLKNMFSIAKIIAGDQTRLDYEGNPLNSVLKDNAEYRFTVDMSTLCAKRLVYTGTLDAIQKAMPNTVLTSEDLCELRKLMMDRGYEVACGICYVESRRRELGSITKGFVDIYNEALAKGEDMMLGPKNNRQAFPTEGGNMLTLADVNTTEGIENIQLHHPKIYAAYMKYMNSRGVSKPKLIETRTDYRGEILQLFNTKRAVSDRNENGGLRIQSFSDFEVVHLIDMMQVITDMAQVGLSGQAYTKVPNFAEAMGRTGLKINLSLIAKGEGVDADGNLIFDDIEGMPAEDAFRLRKKYSKNVGTVLVGKSDAHIRAALADPRIDFVIPFHKSGWSESLYEKLGLKNYSDYTNFQNERPVTDSSFKWDHSKSASENYAAINKIRDKSRRIDNFLPMDYWDFSLSGEENARNYLEACYYDGRIPKFPQFVNEPGYWKLLIDFKMYDNNGVGAPQLPVRPDFNMTQARRMLKEYDGGHAKLPVAQDVVDDFVKRYKAGGSEFADDSDVKYSGRYDYDALVSKPDMRITMLDNTDGIDRQEAYRRGRENVAQYANRFYKNTTPIMYVSDLGKNVMVGRRALEHGLDRRANKQKGVIAQIGDILNNSIVINEADPKKEGVKNSWILLGAAMDRDGRLIYVRSVVNQSTLEIDDVSALYAVYGKKNEAGRVVTAYERANGSGVPSSLTISIADLLEGVNGLFDDVISEDVANRLGIERSESEFTERLRFQQRDPDQISDRELLATALQNVTQNADEWDNLRRYQKKIAALNEKQRMLEQTDARIAELKGKSDRASRDELIRMQNNARTLARSIERADGELLKYEAMKPIKKLAERQREDYRQKLKARTDERMRKYKERMKQDMQDRIREVRAREAERGKQRLDKAVEHAREVGNRRVDRLKESEAKAKYRERIQKDVSTLREWLTQPTNKGHVPQFLRAPLADFLESLDFTSARALRGGDATKADQKMLEKMDALRRALANTRSQQADIENGEAAYRGYLDLPEGFADEFDAAVADIRATLEQGGTDIPVNRMTAEQLKTLSNMIRTINTAVRKANSFLANRRYQTVSGAAQDSIRTLSRLGAKSARNAILEKAGGFLDWTNATPYYVFKRLGDGGKAVFEGLMDGWDRLAFNSRRLIDYANSCYTTEQVRAWSQELHEIKLGGATVKMTTAQIMSLYCLNKRAQARGHLLGGGMRIADIVTKGKTITQADNHILGAQDIMSITKLLTAEQRSVADKLQEFMNTVCTDWGNEVSMQRFGYEAFGDEANYFPIETDSNNRKAIDEQAQENSLFRLLNLSATKSTIKNANNALVVRDIFDVFSAHCTDMAKYNALALPILDALKWYNYVEKTNFEDGSLATESVQKALEKAYGKDAQKYIKNFLRDLNGVREGGRNDGLFSRMTSNYKIAAVAANLRVGLLQITSMPRAAYAIDPKYLAIGVAKNATLKNSRRAEANVGICLWKSLGFYDTNISRNVREMVKHDQSVGGRIKEKSLILAEKGDAWTMGVLYGAVEAEMADKRPGVAKGSKAYSEMVNARVREIVYQTQVVDSTMTRSDIMRDTGAKSSLATAFMSEPTLTMNMLADSIYEQRMKARESGKKLIAPSKKMVRAFAVNAVVLAFSSVMEAAFTAWRDDDEYETFAEKFDDSFLDTLLENVNPANNLPFVKDVAEALQGRSTARMDNTWAYTLGQGVTEVYKYLTGQSKNPAYNGIYKTLNGLSQMSGFAVGGLTREVVSLYNNLIAAPMGYTRIQTYNDSASDAADAILRAYAAGDSGLIERYTDIAAKHGIEGDKLENAIKSAAGEAFVAGELDADGVRAVLKEHAGKSDGDVDELLLKWGYKVQTGLEYADMKDDYIAGNIDRATALEYYGKDKVAQWDYEKETGSSYSDMREEYVSGRMTASQAREYLMAYGGKTEAKADEQIDRWDYYAATGESDNYTKYWRMYYAFENGGDFRKYAQEWIDAGVKKSYIASSIAGRYKEEYLAIKGTAAGDAMLERLLDLYEAIGYNREYERKYINDK